MAKGAAASTVPASRAGMANRTWFPDDEEDASQHANTAPRPDRVATVLYPNVVDDIAVYSTPQSGFFSYLPNAWVPYAELIRLNEPASIFYFYYPVLFGTFFAACLSPKDITYITLFIANILLFTSAFLARSASSAWTDALNAGYDSQFPQYRLRPIARGAISPLKGILLATFLLATYLGIMALFPEAQPRHIATYLVLNALYPLVKRYTSIGPFWRGISLAKGIIIGSSVLGVDIMTLRVEDGLLTDEGAAMMCLWVATALWLTSISILQSFQTLNSDREAGNPSFAIAHAHHAKRHLTILAGAQLGLLCAAGALLKAGEHYYSGACGLTTMALGWMLLEVDLEDGESCGGWAKWGPLGVGACVGMALLSEFESRRQVIWGKL